MDKSITYVSFYTEGTPYEEIAHKYIVPSLKKFDLPYLIFKQKNKGNWGKNVADKPGYILQALEEVKNDVVFLDADAIIEKFPILFYEIPKSYDLALHFLDWQIHYGYSTPQPKELLSGTLLLRYNPLVIEIVKKWSERALSNTTIWEQKLFQEVVKEYEEKLKIYNLPVEYITIIDKNGHLPKYINEPIITHYQASRTLKRKMNEF